MSRAIAHRLAGAALLVIVGKVAFMAAGGAFGEVARLVSYGVAMGLSLIALAIVTIAGAVLMIRGRL